MNILFQYTKRILKANKGRTVITIAGIVLSFALFTAVLTAVSSGLHFMINFIIAETGDWYGVVYQCTDEEQKELEQQKEVTGAVSIENQGVAYLEGVLTEAKPYAYVGGVDQEFCDVMSICLTTGRLPETPDEILVPEHVENAGLIYRIGDQITLQLGERFSDEGAHLQHFNHLHSGIFGSESIDVTGERTFTVVGFYKRPGFESVENPAYTFLTVKNNSGTEDVYFKTKDISAIKGVIEAGFSDHLSDVNAELMRYTGNSNDSVKKMLLGVGAVLCGVIAFVSVSLIYNAFSISLGERTKQFGLLKSIGATKKQIRMIVFMETALLCVISIPLGLMIGCFGVWGVLTFLQPAFRVMQSESSAVHSVDIVFYVEPMYLVAAAGVGIVTVMIAAFIPAWRANRLSPIESIRQTTDVKASSAKGVRGRGLWGRMFGIAGTLAYKNAKRNKKPYRAIVFSLVTSLVLLFGGGGLVYYMEQSIDIMTQAYQYDIDFVYGTTLSDDESEEIESYLNRVDAIDEFCQVIEQDAYMNCKDRDGFAYGGKIFAEKMCSGEDFPVTLLYVEDAFYKAYLETLGLDFDEYLYAEKPKALVVNQIKGYYADENGKSHTFGGEFFQSSADLSSCALWAPKRLEGSVSYYFSDDTIGYYFDNGSGEYDDIELSKEDAQVFFGFELGALIDEKDRPYWLGTVGGLTFILPMSAASTDTEQVFADGRTHFYLLANDVTSAERSVRSIKREVAVVKNFSCINIHADVNFNQAFSQIMQVFMLCFVVLLCLIAIANITNTITTSVRLRTREYAMLKSIGISSKTMFQFALIENLTYSLKALVIGCLLGVGLNYLTLHAVTEVFETGFSLPMAYYIAGIIGTVMLIFFAVFYMRAQTRKGNVCEELRNEVL